MASLGIRHLEHLGSALGVSVPEILRAIDSVDQHYEELELIHPQHPEKRRIVIDVRGPIRLLQSRFYKRVLLPKLTASPNSHGGVRGRSIKTNVQPHIASSYVLKLDISDFFPSVHFRRVYKLFFESLSCSPDVARVLTRLCTYKHHLALGLITSPILADQILKRVDRRIAGACKEIGLVYTRFVDDVTVSGPFAFDNGTARRTIEEILKQDGFKCNSSKSYFGVLDYKISITGICIRRGKVDLTTEYCAELNRQLRDLKSLSMGGEFVGPYYTKDQMRGRIQFACWLNAAKKSELIRRFRAIRWSRVSKEASRRNLVVCRPHLVRKVANENDDGTGSGEPPF